jgi:hypothetical protein
MDGSLAALAILLIPLAGILAAIFLTVALIRRRRP